MKLTAEALGVLGEWEVANLRWGGWRAGCRGRKEILRKSRGTEEGALSGPRRRPQLSVEAVCNQTLSF